MAASKTARGKVGRPPLERAGEVEERILDAAKTVFLAHGFEGASVDEIAQTARAGKPTIYARFPSKAALFAAVIGRHAGRNTQYENLAPQGRTFRARLISLGQTLIERSCVDETIGLMRTAIAENPRFPELTLEIQDSARKRATANVAHAISELARAEGLAGKAAFAADRIEETARIFLDIVVFAMLIRILLGEDMRTLKKEAQAHVEKRVDFFLAATT
ncbi:putative transcriptional regulatory protein, TetR family [Bradyrhizobium sp. ORS 375]|uniref:TetR/AcrR family transcriptional regulator n=1 Tax=Bradyrhizobium sp. (strain ORS 375) TaxID=566679 RepID=UPI0002408BBB|nr:TetR/AcrR family transcriptional regulator [Bradyrhizobium sp. ORS 375]CCD96546.1 putative transcriptional regulatory protein, TetR family [Bradyrhizobium sp. ORS 375]